jgi:uridine kinase
MTKPFIIGIAGGSGSGKTTIARKIFERCAGIPILTLQLDHYYRDLAHLEPLERDKLNFDHPDSLEMPLLVKHVELLAKGEGVDRPTYEFASHTRSSKVLRLETARVIIIEGIFALYSPEIRRHLSCSIFVDVSDDVRFIRRLQRDITERGRSNEGVIKQYLETVKPMHDQFVAPTKFNADLIIHWDHYKEQTIEMLANMIRTSI